MSSICSAKTIVAEEKFSIYDTLPALESWYQNPNNNNIQDENTSCLKKLRRKNNKIVSFCPDPPTIYDTKEVESLLPRNCNYRDDNDSITTGCCGNIKVKSFIRSIINK